MENIIRTGLCSYGMSGKLFHAPFVAAHPGYSFDAIVERSTNDAVKKFPSVKVYRSIEELVNDPALDLIIVNTPVQTHFEFSKLALEAGKHVILEKPMVITPEEGEKLQELATANNKLLIVYQNRRYDSDFRVVKQVVKEQLLGNIREATIAYDRFRPAPSAKWHKEGDLPGSGILYDLGAHLIDQSLQLFGYPRGIYADLAVMRDEGVADDYFEILFFYEKLRVRLKASTLVKELGPAFILHGTRGSFIKSRSDIQEELLLKDTTPSIENWAPSPAGTEGVLTIEENGETVRKTIPTPVGNYMEFFNDAWQALTGGAENPVPAADGIRIIRLIEAAKMSAINGKKSTFDGDGGDGKSCSVARLL